MCKQFLNTKNYMNLKQYNNYKNNIEKLSVKNITMMTCKKLLNIVLHKYMPYKN